MKDSHLFVGTMTDIKALTKFLDDPHSEDSLKLDILGWMWDNKNKINYPGKQKKKFHYELLTFLQLIGAKE